MATTTQAAIRSAETVARAIAGANATVRSQMVRHPSFACWHAHQAGQGKLKQPSMMRLSGYPGSRLGLPRPLVVDDRRRVRPDDRR